MDSEENMGMRERESEKNIRDSVCVGELRHKCVIDNVLEWASTCKTVRADEQSAFSSLNLLPSALFSFYVREKRTDVDGSGVPPLLRIPCHELYPLGH